MKKLTALFLLTLLPTLADAALLRYELTFTPWDWPPEIGVYPNGTGHLIANTEFNAIVGGELKSDEFHFFWTNTTLDPMEFLGTPYDDWHVVRAGGSGIDAMSGVAGSLNLMFFLPPDLDNYSASLDHQINDDFWSELTFPDNGPPADQWQYYDLDLFFTFSPPTVMNDYSVSEPPAYTLLWLGLLAFGAIRLGRPSCVAATATSQATPS